MLRKPLLLIVGGYDTACEPGSGYGLMLDARWRLMIRTALNLADHVLALSEFQLAEVQHWAPRARAGYLHLGVDASRFRPRSDERESLVLTTSRIGTDWVRKGLETFVLTARRMPEVRFAILGAADYAPALDRLRNLASRNVAFLGGLSHNEVPAVLARARVYAQLSSHESFCLALAEAMAAGCSPVVTRCGALPEVAGDCARYVPPNDPDAAAEAIRAALLNPAGAPARQRIIERFPVERRAMGLRAAVRAVSEIRVR
jgi:glycosyltransferase involved in cell wall biosynthesis